MGTQNIHKRKDLPEETKIAFAKAVADEALGLTKKKPYDAERGERELELFDAVRREFREIAAKRGIKIDW